MSPERWRQIEELYQAALERAPESRQAFLEGACRHDAELRREVDSLLIHAEQAGGFLETPAMEAGMTVDATRSSVTRPSATKGVGERSTSFTLGQIVSHYRIEAKLGEGGMGVVYKARDTRLDRFVAIKTLSADAAGNPERKRRFMQEAKAASGLNHPNILHVYDIDTAEGVDFIAMEYVEGKTLQELIGRKGLPVRETLKHAVQIADGLATAHAAGIVHRDIKPGNIMVNKKGLVKILDFGLAKLTEPAEDEEGATQTMGPRTQEGTIVGTVAYMSPEQAEGKRVDARSEIFSLGSVLYEMLSGQQAFQGNSKLATMSAILHQEPKPLEELAAGIPYDLPRLVTQCLRKDPGRRLQHMEDVKVLLEQLGEESGSGKVAARTAATPLRIPILAKWIAVGLVPLAVLVWYLASHLNREAPLTATFTQLTNQPGQELYPSLSPDGKSFVYQSRASGNWDIYLQRVGGKNPINLTKDSPEDDIQPAFSPDGERIAFRSERDGGGIFVMGATGESVKRLTDFGYNPAWSPDGKEIVCATTGFGRADVRMGRRSQLFVVNVSTQEKRLITPKLQDCVQPHWSPRGDRIACWGYIGANRDIWTVPALGGDPVPVTADLAFDWSPVWSPDGQYIYFASDRGGSMNLWRVRVEERSGRPLASPEPFTTPSPYSSQLSFSRDGRRLAYVQETVDSNLNKVAFDSARGVAVGRPVPLTQDSVRKTQLNASPDGRWLVFASVGAREDLFVIQTDGTGMRQLTDDAARDRMPAWSPDGKRIAFYSDRSGKYEAWIINADGSGLRQLTIYPSDSVLTPLWSPDGARIACTVQNGIPFLIDANKDRRDQSPQHLTPLAEKGTWLWLWSWSADGRKLAATLMRSDAGSAGFGIYSLESNQFQPLAASGGWPVWLRDGRRLLYLEGRSGASWPGAGKMFVIDSISGKAHEALSVDPLEFGSNFGLPRHEKALYFTVLRSEADVWLATSREP